MSGDELVRFRLECSTSMYEQSTDILDQKTIFIRLLYGSKYGLLWPSTIKHDFYSINLTFIGFTYGPTPYDLYTILTRLSSLVEWTSFAVVYTVSCGLTRSLTVLYDANTIIHGHGTRVSFLKVLKIIHGFHGYTRTPQV